MKGQKILILSVLLFLVIFSVPILADQIATIIVWIEGTINVGPGNYNRTLVMDAGDTNGTWITIENTGNIRDVLRMEGNLVEAVPGQSDWIKFAFRCSESTGICEDNPTSDRKYVDQIALTPDINQTSFYIEVTGYKTTLPGQVNLTIDGYSLTNKTKQSDYIVIGIVVRQPSGTASPSELSGISAMWSVLLVLLSVPVFYRKLA